jgi:DNA/RNA-binding domain of Phe-tRNA-synthetase-like protein
VQLSDQIHSEIFALCPGYCWGKVLCWDLDNSRPSTPADDQLRQAEAAVRADPELAEVAAHPRIAAWRDAFSAFGARPSKFQSSVEALVRRALRGDRLPAVSLLVGLYNAASLRYLLPIGGDDLDRIEGGLHLRRAIGGELYHELGSRVCDPPLPGEVIYADDHKVLCRRWCWRQADDSKITTLSRAVVLNIHGLPPASREQVQVAASELAELVPRFCGGRSTWYVLDRDMPRKGSEQRVENPS